MGLRVAELGKVSSGRGACCFDSRNLIWDCLGWLNVQDLGESGSGIILPPLPAAIDSGCHKQ